MIKELQLMAIRINLFALKDVLNLTERRFAANMLVSNDTI